MIDDHEFFKFSKNQEAVTSWRKPQPLKTYSRKSLPAVLPGSDGESTNTCLDGHRSRFGRAIKQRTPSQGFLVNDRQSIKSMLLHSSYSSKYDCACREQNYARRAKSYPSEEENSSLVPKLDLDRPSSPATLEKPLGLLVDEGAVAIVKPTLAAVAPDSPSPSITSSTIAEPTMSNYAVGDLVFAQVPSHPYWPAVITRDPVTDVPFRQLGRTEKWHVHFLGCNGIRAWVSQNYILPFDRDAFAKKKAETLALRETGAKLVRKSIKMRKKAFIVASQSLTAWNSANNEADSLLNVTRADRLDYLTNSTVRLHPQTWRLSEKLSSEENPETQSAKKARLSEPTPMSTSYRPSPKTVRLKGAKDPSKAPIAPLFQDLKGRKRPKKMELNDIVKQEKKSLCSETSSPTKKSRPVIGDLVSNNDSKPSFNLGIGGVKRGRGRPRKYPLPLPLSSSLSLIPHPSQGIGESIPQPANQISKSRKFSLPANLNSLDQLPSAEHNSPNEVDTEKSKTKFGRMSTKTPRHSTPSVLEKKKNTASPPSSEKSLRQTLLDFKPISNGEPKNVEAEVKIQKLVKGSGKKSTSNLDSQQNTVAIIKETIAATSSRKKFSLFNGDKDVKICSICLKGKNVVKCRGPCNLYMHIDCADKHRFSSPTKLLDSPKRLKKNKERLKREKAIALSANHLEDPKVDEINGKDGVNDEVGELKREETPQSIDYDRLASPLAVSPHCNNGSTLTTDAINQDNASSNCDGHIKTNGGEVGDLHSSEVIDELDTYTRSPGLPTPPADSPSTSDGAYEVEADNSAVNRIVLKNSSDAEKPMKKEGKEKGWWCNMCLDGVVGPCFACGKNTGDLLRCKIGQCGNAFHLECLKEWPQKLVQSSATGKTTLICPAHECHTCISCNPASLFSQSHHDSKLVRCLRCPAAYHPSDHCIPAGVQILSSTQIICPTHYMLDSPVASVNWCCLCSTGGFLILCDRCPNAFHADCLCLKSAPEGKFICEECETGRFPLYGEIVWAKCGSCRWWPARVLYPHEYSPALLKADHRPGEFGVKFFGSNDCYWVFRGRAFSYHEGDANKTELQLSKLAASKSLSRYDTLFYFGVQEANAAFIEWTQKRSQHEQSWRPTMKPPKFKKIMTNKPIGAVKLNDLAVPATLSCCECQPDSEDPCGPSTNCLNRILFVECTPNICKCGDKCRNRNFEKKSTPQLLPFYTESKGWGLKTAVPIKKGDFIIEYVGEVIDEDEFNRRMAMMRENKEENYYFLTLDKDKMLDAGPRGNLARFMNHSCQPNCLTEKWTVGLQIRVGIFAMEDIQADTELVFNYNFTRTELMLTECRCGAPNCAGFIGGKPIKIPRPVNSIKPVMNGKAPTGRRKKGRKRKRSSSVTSQKTVDGSQILELTTSNAKKTNDAILPPPVVLSMDSKCFICGLSETQLDCWHNTCTRTFHLKCMDLNDYPATKRWLCPSHYCRVCNKDYLVEKCSLCVNAYCSAHQEGNMLIRRGKQPVCCFHTPTTTEKDSPVVKMEIIESENPDEMKDEPAVIVVNDSVAADEVLQPETQPTSTNEEPLPASI